MQTTGLRYFLAVSRTGSITAAADQLNVAASAISRQIASLETELDCLLFERRPRGMVLSSAGELLAGHAHRVLIGATQVATEIQELRGLSRGLIRVGSSEGFAVDLLPNAISTFQRTHAGIRFDLAISPPAQVTKKVASGDVDIGLTFPLAATKSIDVIYQGVVDMVMVATAGHPLACRTELCLSDLQAYPVALTTHDTTSRQIFEGACIVEGVAIEPVLTANAISALVPFMRTNHALVPMSAVAVGTYLREGSLISFPLRTKANLTRSIQIQAMRDRELPHACRTFIEHLLTFLPGAEAP